MVKKIIVILLMINTLNLKSTEKAIKNKLKQSDFIQNPKKWHQMKSKARFIVDEIEYGRFNLLIPQFGKHSLPLREIAPYKKDIISLKSQIEAIKHYFENNPGDDHYYEKMCISFIPTINSLLKDIQREESDEQLENLQDFLNQVEN